ncbi:MAG: methyltransferase domain-containing protein [Nitrospinaceae bacterium]|nr:methyltransferase domain-containing protein [Nitrospinaceae bacterium]MBT6395751.1 methyltransferase domain-containing protein [Nitrospinaceae bacterium]
MKILMRGIKKVLKFTGTPLEPMQLAYFELRLLIIRIRNRIDPSFIIRRRSLLSLDDVCLHFGCGGRNLPGWLNIDGDPRPGVEHIQDLRQPLPLRDNTCQYIFTEHVIEHIDMESLERTLKELHRVLKSDGVLRIIVPDCSKYADAYLRKDLNFLQNVAPGCKTIAEGLNIVFVGVLHKFIYDFETLKIRLIEVGFQKVEESTHMGSKYPELRIDSENPSRNPTNLYVEAKK